MSLKQIGLDKIKEIVKTHLLSALYFIGKMLLGIVGYWISSISYLEISLFIYYHFNLDWPPSIGWNMLLTLPLWPLLVYVIWRKRKSSIGFIIGWFVGLYLIELFAKAMHCGAWSTYPC
jgi:hypothetical protein